MQWEVLERIRARAGYLTRRQRQVAAFLARDVQKLAFAPAAVVAREAGVSEATVVRLAQSLGYGGFAEMQAGVRAQANQQLAGLGVARRQALSHDFAGEADVLTAVAQRHRESIGATVAGTDRAAFRAVAARIAAADCVCVAAHHWSRALGWLLVDLLRSVTCNAHLFGSQEEREWQLASITPRSVVVGVAFPRYPTETLVLLQAARQRGAWVAAVTDTVTSPLAGPAASVLTVAGISTQPGSDFFAGAVTLLYALHVAVSVAAGQPEEQRLADLQAAYRLLGTFAEEGQR